MEIFLSTSYFGTSLLILGQKGNFLEFKSHVLIPPLFKFRIRLFEEGGYWARKGTSECLYIFGQKSHEQNYTPQNQKDRFTSSNANRQQHAGTTITFSCLYHFDILHFENHDMRTSWNECFAKLCILEEEFKCKFHHFANKKYQNKESILNSTKYYL